MIRIFRLEQVAQAQLRAEFLAQQPQFREHRQLTRPCSNQTMESMEHLWALIHQPWAPQLARRHQRAQARPLQVFHPIKAFQ